MHSRLDPGTQDPHVIRVSVTQEKTQLPVTHLEERICDEVERRGLRAAPYWFLPKGATPGPPDLLEQLFSHGRQVFEALGAIAIVASARKSIKKRSSENTDALAIGAHPDDPLLYVWISVAGPRDEDSPPPITIRDVVSFIPAMRNILQGNRYLMDLSAPTLAGGGVGVFNLEPHDLEGKSLKRLVRTVDQLSASSGRFQVFARNLRTWRKMKEPWIRVSDSPSVL